MTVEHAEDLRVHHSLSSTRPGDLVTEVCTTATCPWPKQLWLKDTVVVELSQMATWDLFHYPFDTQIVRATLPVLSKSTFAHASDYNSSHINLSLPLADYFAPLYNSIYEPDDWAVYSAKVYDSPDHGTIFFELKVARQSMTTVFKVSNSANSTRYPPLALSCVTCVDF